MPAVSDPSKWDTGSRGLKHKLSMHDVERQLENAINTILPSNSQAQHIAKECLYKSKLFSTELFTFMSEDFNKWVDRGHSKSDAWKMTCVSVRCIFEEIHSEHVAA